MYIFSKKDFGDDFIWGVSASAYQTEGAWNVDGKGRSVWDEFTQNGKAYDKQTGNEACDFYHRYEEDIKLMSLLGFKNFRFSMAWTRIFPEGTGIVNMKGVDFYHRVIDCCLENGIEPWITLYHWDLPYILQNHGGWSNREIINWFSEYVSFVVKTYGDKVKKWMVLNEPLVFTGAGYFMGAHAPGFRNLKMFLQAVHHTALVQGMAPEIMRSFYNDLEIGTTFSCSHLQPYWNHPKHHEATLRADAVLNHLFIDPVLGLGYPDSKFKPLRKIYDYVKDGDENKLKGRYDFIGLQNYTREVIKYAWYVPFLKAKIIPADKRRVHHTQMNWEVHPPAIYHILKKFQNISETTKIIITENGAALHDEMNEQGEIKDIAREYYLREYLWQVLKAKREGVNVKGYFVWSFTDNFEWAEGFRPKFGLVHVDFKTQKRTVKDSAKWYNHFLENEKVEEPEKTAQF
jgi:beta-glucosidase